MLYVLLSAAVACTTTTRFLVADNASLKVAKVAGFQVQLYISVIDRIFYVQLSCFQFSGLCQTNC